MSVILDIEKTNSKLLYIKRFFVEKKFQSFPRCYLSVAFFDLKAGHASDLAGKQFNLFWVKRVGHARNLIFSGRIFKVSMNKKLDHIACELECYPLGRYTCGEEQIFHVYWEKKQKVIDILKKIKKFRPDFNFKSKIGNSQLKVPHLTGLQVGKTDFEYVRELLALYGLPVFWDDEEDELSIGWQNTSDDLLVEYRPENDSYFQFEQGSILATPQAEKNRTPPYGHTDWDQTHGGWSNLCKHARNTYRDQIRLQENFYEFSTTNKIFNPGDLIESKLNPLQSVYVSKKLISWRVVQVRYFYQASGNLQVKIKCAVNEKAIWIPPFTILPKNPQRLLAEVSRTDPDPEELGRIEVDFPFKDKKLFRSMDKAWLPVITPFEGSYEGFCFLPEPGNKVIVDCLDYYQGLWCVTGTLRTKKKKLAGESTHQIKCLQTSKGNKVIFQSKPTPDAPSQEQITIHNRNNKLDLRSTNKKSEFCFSQGKDTVLKIITKGNDTNIEITATGNIQITGDKIKIKAKSEFELDVNGKCKVNADNDISIKSSEDVKIAGDNIQLN